MRTITVQGETIHVHEVGKGAPLLFLHGHPDTAAMWLPIAEQLADSFHCIMPNLPGFGESRLKQPFDNTLANRGQYVEDVLNALNITEKVNIVSHDHGGPFAMTWAVQHPERVHKQVIMNSLYHAEYRWHFWARLWRTPLLGEYLAVITPTAFGNPIWRRELRRGSKGLPLAHCRETHDKLSFAMMLAAIRLYRASDPQVFNGWQEQFRERVATIPTMVLWGEKDPYLPLDLARSFADWGAELLTYPDAGHWLMVEKPDDVSQQLRRFFND